MAAAAYPAWSKTGPAERRGLLLKAANVLESKVDEFARIMIEETGEAHLGQALIPCWLLAFSGKPLVWPPKSRAG